MQPLLAQQTTQFGFCISIFIRDSTPSQLYTHRYHCYRELHFNSRLDMYFAKVSEALNIVQGHQVMVRARRVFQG